MKYTLPRGTKDILPDEVHLWQYVEEVSRNIFSRYGYEEIRTPIFEMTELFERGIGGGTDIVEKEMYSFQDKGGRNLTLRPEGTASVARAYISNGLYKTHSHSKLYYCGPMFRYERPQAGRYRQFHQIGVENIGINHPSADAEVILLGIRLFDALGLGGLGVSINAVGCPVCRPVIEERLKQFIGSNLESFCEDCNRRFETKPLRILDCKNKKCQTYFSGIPDIRNSLCQSCHDHFTSVLEFLDASHVNFEINPLLVRGLDYYTKTAFEITSDQLGAQNAICGGGRYDNLIKELGGPPTQGVGFAFGVERAVMVLQQFSDITKSDDTILFVAPLGYAQQTEAFKLIDDLRRAGLNCRMDFDKTDLAAQLKRADKLGASHVLIFGEAEAEKRTIIVKDMKERTQIEIPMTQVIDHFSGTHD
jgi:histidyl-tRNA synthetase